MNNKISYVVIILVSAFLLSCSSSGSRVDSNSAYYIEQAGKLGFPTGEINRWINNAMSQNNCELVRVSSVEADGDWCLKLYMDVIWYRSFRDEGEPRKAVVDLYFEPSDGHIWDGSFRAAD